MFFLQPLDVFYWILKRFPAFGNACCQATIIFEILSRNDDFGFGRVARSNKTFGCCKLIHTTNKLWPVPQCQNFNQTRPPNPFFTTCPGMTKLKTLISKTFVLFWIVIYDIKFIQFRIRASVPSSSSSITSATASCLLLTLRVSRAGSNIALFSSRVPAGPSSHYFFGQNISSRCKSYHHTLFLCLS